jgi:predicted RNA-binding Zn-ribbon protein involved in translation (DUF1610 family)
MKPITVAVAVALVVLGFRVPVHAQAAPGPVQGLTQAQRDQIREETRKSNEEARATLQKVHDSLRASGIAIPAAMATLQGLPSVEILFASHDIRVTVDFDNETLKEALTKLFADAKQEFDVEDGVPVGDKVCLKAKNIRLASALQALTEQTGTGWTAELLRKKTDKQIRTRYRILGSAPSRSSLFPMPPQGIYSPRLPSAATDMGAQTARTFVINTMEQRRTFECPHCGGEVTTVMPRGTRRSNVTWRFCPLCGKPVDMEEDAESGADLGKIEPGTQLKIHVLYGPDDKVQRGLYEVDSAGRLRLKSYNVSLRVVGYTTGQLENELALRLRPYIKDPKVSATIVTRK